MKRVLEEGNAELPAGLLTLAQSPWVCDMKFETTGELTARLVIPTPVLRDR